MTFADSKQRFSNRVADYVLHRPGYPPALIGVLQQQCRLTQQQVIADIGSGTGILSKLFLDHGNRVFGVEPNSEMRAAGEEFLRDYKNFTSIAAEAESTKLTDASVDFVAAGQAFHWFQPEAARREFRRILTPDGWVVIVWNDRRSDESPFSRQYEELLHRYGTDYARIKASYPDANRVQKFFGQDTFGARELANHQLFDFPALLGRLKSSSYIPQEDHPHFSSMLADLQRVFNESQQDGVVRMEYITRIYFAQLKTGED
jgi:SAM-dependent methyltransferase